MRCLFRLFLVISLLWCSVLDARQMIVPVEGQPIRFAADHDGANTKAYRLEVNGAVVGTDTPVSTLSSGVIAIQIAGLSAGTHTARMGAVGTDGAVVWSTVLTFTVVSSTPPPPTFSIQRPKTLRVEFPAPPTGPNDTALDYHSAWASSSAGKATVSVPAVNVGQTVLVSILHTSATASEYTVSGIATTRLAAAVRSATDSRGVVVFASAPATVAGPVTVQISGAADAIFRASAQVLSANAIDAWSEMEPGQSTDHACGPDPWAFEDDGIALCLVTTVSGSVSAVTPTNATKVSPGIGTGGWLLRTGEPGEDARIRFTSSPDRRFGKVAIRVR
jgi:hypothetical protein